MVSWKQRLYAFLLRRWLGPFLTKESLAKLHSCLNVSLQEGTFLLTGVAFKSYSAEHLGLIITSVHISRLEIRLTLQERDEDAQSSLAWKAMQLGNGPGVSVMADIILDGVLMSVQPCSKRCAPVTSSPLVDDVKEKSALTSYLEAALASLRLTVRMNDLQLRVNSPIDGTVTSWIQVHATSFLFQDVENSCACSQSSADEQSRNQPLQRMSKDEISVQKVMEVSSITVTTGDTKKKTDTNSSAVLFLDGGVSAKLRVTKQSCICPDTGPYNRVQQNLEATVQKKLHVSLDRAALHRIHTIVQKYQTLDDSTGEETSHKIVSPARQPDMCDDDSTTMNTIIKQYQEARAMVERKEMRGGILIPTIDDQETGEVTFDAFFDANDLGFSQYTSLLRDSLYNRSRSNDESAMDDTVVQLHFHEIEIKLVLQQESAVQRKFDEYLLLSICEIDHSSSFSKRLSDYSLTIRHCEIENALHSDSNDSSTLEIQTLVSFPRATGDHDLLVDAPCISIRKKSCRGEENRTMEIDVDIEPIKLFYKESPIAKLTKQLAETLSFPTQSTSDVYTEHVTRVFNLACSLVEIVLPISREKDLAAMFRRCGYSSRGNMTSPALTISATGVALDTQNSDDGNCYESTLTCRHILAFAASPNSQSILDRSCQQFDIFAFSGHGEVEPCIPLRLKMMCSSNMNIAEDAVKDSASRLFPKVPALSSFKARQDIDGEHPIVDRHKSLEGIRSNEESDGTPYDSGSVQSKMISELSKCTATCSIAVPEIFADLTMDELNILKVMVDEICCRQPPTVEAHPHSSGKQMLAVFVECEMASVTIQDEHSESHKEIVAFMIKSENVRGNILLGESEFKHVRLLADEFSVYEIHKAVQISPLFGTKGVDSRVDGLRRRGTYHSDSTRYPILYRSHLFPPISPSSPTFLFDCINSPRGDSESMQRSVFFTIYDTTYRHNHDSDLFSRVPSILKKLFDSQEKMKNQQVVDPPTQLLTRAFMSMADCNLDYSSSSRFRTASRTLLRLGHLKISSNILQPEQCAQSYSLSLGDLSVCLCNSRYPYNFENSKLGLKTNSKSKKDGLNLCPKLDSDVVRQAMNYKTILTLSTMDAIINVQREKSTEKPYCRSSLTIGELSLLACKDSFEIFQSTIIELVAELTALTDDDFRLLVEESIASDETSWEKSDSNIAEEKMHLDNDSSDNSKPREDRDSVAIKNSQHSFLLDGYDWTTVDFEGASHTGVNLREEQSAGWYKTHTKKGDDEKIHITSEIYQEPQAGPHIISHHFNLHPVSDPICDGDMGISKLVRGRRFDIESSLVIHDFSLTFRLFDGFDWPELVKSDVHSAVGDAFLIPEVKAKTGQALSKTSIVLEIPCDTKAKLMGDLLSESHVQESPFENLPLPDDHNRTLKERLVLQRLARRPRKYLQVEASGVSIRFDSVQKSTEHRLASCLNLKVRDFFVAETISNQSRPVKMIGEWFNEAEHPRDSNEGLLMMKMITLHGRRKVDGHNEIPNDEGEIGLTLLPLRCIMDQRAIAFARAFFSPDENNSSLTRKLPIGLHARPPPWFTMVRVRAFKLKVDYTPQKLDSRALRDGAIVELINLSSLSSMVLTLKQVEVTNKFGFGEVVDTLVRRWVQDICSTQLLKFVTKASPFEPISEVSGAMMDMLVLPWDAFRNGDSIQQALRKGTKSFSTTLAFEFLSLSSRISDSVGGNASRVSSAASTRIGDRNHDGEGIPSRPLATPRHILDAGPHAANSIARGFQEANLKIVIIPFREFRRNGATGAVKSVLKGIPVAIGAPVSGTAEALSYALLGARNQIRPDVRKEEEVSMKGLNLRK